MSEIAIDVKDLRVRYRCLNKMSIRKSLFKLKKSQVEMFEAVKGISFSVPKGKVKRGCFTAFLHS